MAVMKESTKNILNFLKSATDEVTAPDIAEALGVPIKSVNGSLTALGNKKLIERVPATVTGEDGQPNSVKFIHLTDAGKEFDPETKAETKADAE